MAAAGAAAGKTRTGSKSPSFSKVVVELAAFDEQLRNAQVQPPWVKTTKANIFFGCVIVANGAFIGVDIELGDGFSWGLWITESIFLVLFWVEIVLRLLAERPHIRRFFDTWGSFDLAVTVLGCADAWVLTPIVAYAAQDGDSPLSSLTVFRMLRLFRLVRLVRVFRKFGELLVLIKTIKHSVKAVGWMTLLLGMLIYTGSIFTLLLLGQPYKATYPEVELHFGSLGRTLFSHFRLVTLEGWPAVAAAAMDQNRWWAIYFAVAIIIGNYALVNVMVGIIVEQVIRFTLEQEYSRASFDSKAAQLRSTMRTFFDAADLDHSGDLSRSEIRSLMADKRAHEIMTTFGINLDIPPDTLYAIMDLNGDDATTFEEFFDACMRLCGSTENVHSVFVQQDVCECHEALAHEMELLEKELQTATAKAATPIGSSIRGLETQANDDDVAVEAELWELSERLDRFSWKQAQLHDELQALKEQFDFVQGSEPELGSAAASAGAAADVAGGVASTGPDLAAAVAAGRAPKLLLQGVGRDLGERVMDAFFGSPLSSRRSRSEEPAIASSRGVDGRAHGSLRTSLRRELEAEFATKKSTEAMMKR